MAFGDTGVVIYSNSVCGAYSNFEGGPSALSAGLTGRTPRYGFHLPEQRRATIQFRVEWTPDSLNDWGALGGVIGRLAGNYWAVPVIEGIEATPRSDQLKHFGAAMASFGSIALFHMIGVTPEANRLAAPSAAACDPAAADSLVCERRRTSLAAGAGVPRSFSILSGAGSCARASTFHTGAFRPSGVTSGLPARASS